MDRTAEEQKIIQHTIDVLTKELCKRRGELDGHWNGKCQLVINHAGECQAPNAKGLWVGLSPERVEYHLYVTKTVTMINLSKVPDAGRKAMKALTSSIPFRIRWEIRLDE